MRRTVAKRLRKKARAQSDDPKVVNALYSALKRTHRDGIARNVVVR